MAKLGQPADCPTNRIEFINLIIDHLTAHGFMEPRLLYESPFVDISPQGPDAVFESARVVELTCVCETYMEDPS